MSFQIKIQRNESPLNKIGKRIIDIVTLNGDLKNETDMINPKILVDVDIPDIKYTNYLTIPEFNRKYFIDEIVSVRRNLVMISAHVDVLESFGNLIKENTAVVLRQENDFNLLLNDGVFKAQQNPRIFLRDFPSGLGDFNYILITGGSKK